MRVCTCMCVCVCACMHTFQRGLILVTEMLCKHLFTYFSFQCGVSQDLVSEQRNSSTQQCYDDPMCT